MPKKKVNDEVIEAPISEANGAAEPEPEEVPAADPVLMGVSLPVAMTRAAFMEVAGAWGSCGGELFGAIKAKMAKEPEEEPAAVSETPEEAVAAE